MTLTENLVPISPVNFFQINVNGHYVAKDNITSEQYCLPDTSSLCHERAFADVYLGWNRDGIVLHLTAFKSFQHTYYPEIDCGDSFEVYIDTRDVKTSGFNTRFCHHFFFLPKRIEGHQAGEITRFRTDDTHELCDPNDLTVKTHFTEKGYTMNVLIPKHCLHRYDPDQFDRIGFTYRVNRPDGTPQHFSVVTDDYQIGQQPSLWSSVRLIS